MKKKLEVERFFLVKWQALEKAFIKQKLLRKQAFLFQDESSAGEFQRPLPWLHLIIPGVVHLTWLSEWRKTGNI